MWNQIASVHEPYHGDASWSMVGHLGHWSETLSVNRDPGEANRQSVPASAGGATENSGVGRESVGCGQFV